MADIATRMEAHDYREKPPGSNSDGGGYITYINIKYAGRDGMAWCASDVCEAAHEAGYKQFHTARAADLKYTPGVRTWTDKQIARGIVRPKRGMVAVKGRPGGNHADVALGVDMPGNAMMVRGGNVNNRNSSRKVPVLDLGNRFGYNEFLEVL